MIAIKRLTTADADFAARLETLLAFESAQDDAVEATVTAILADVRQRGDAALIEYTARFDRIAVHSAGELELAPDEMQQALARLPGTTGADWAFPGSLHS